MGWSGNVLTAPISFGDISVATGVGGSTYDLGSMIRNGSLINRWSKMKPVAFPYVDPDRTRPVSAYGKTLWWWKGKPSQEQVAAGLTIGNYTTTDKCMWFTNCGIRYLGFRSQLDAIRAFDPIRNIYNGDANNPIAQNFSYVKPAGGIDNEPYRALDFHNYRSDYPYVIIPDYGTESGTKYVVVKDGSPNNKVRCSIMSYASLDTGPSGLSFNDLFSENGNATFTVILGEAVNPITLVSASITVTADDDYFKEVEIDLNASQLWGKTIVALYCAVITVGQEPYYVPVMQSNNLNYCGNTPITYAPARRVYNSWHVERSTTPYYAMTFTQKQNYGTSFSWGSVAAMSAFMTNGAMNRWYLKIEVPRESSSAYTYTNDLFELELSGQFRDANGTMCNVYYTIDSTTNRMVLKSSEVEAADWGSTESVLVGGGSGTQSVYLAIYNLFNNHGGVTVTNGGTVWRVVLRVKSSQTTYRYEVVYGSLESSSRLNINVPAVTA